MMLGSLSSANEPAMNGEIHQRTIRVANPQGLHMRPILAFVEAANRFQAEVWLQKPGGERVNGRSSWSLLSLGAEQGAELTLETQGPDAPLALAALAEVLLTIPPDDQ